MRTLILASVLLAACGGRGHEDCADGQHWADPDDRGGRCIEDSSICSAASECPAPADACCQAACADPHGSGVYECVENCEAPACTEGSCGVDQVCQVIDACQAYCVPDDVECSDDAIPADPAGTGQFVCVRTDSTCFAAADCATAALVDPCCPNVCSDTGDGLYACVSNCGAAGFDAEPMVACECAADADCITQYGQGWQCSQATACGGGCSCEPDPSCQCRAAPQPVCGADGQTYDSACGQDCVPVEIACEGECPCVPGGGCGCAAGAYVPVCGADGQTYDAACGDVCVPVAIACRGECPCV